MVPRRGPGDAGAAGKRQREEEAASLLAGKGLLLDQIFQELGWSPLSVPLAGGNRERRRSHIWGDRCQSSCGVTRVRQEFQCKDRWGGHPGPSHVNVEGQPSFTFLSMTPYSL